MRCPMNHRLPMLALATATAAVAVLPSAADAAVSGQGGGYKLRLAKPMGTLTIPQDQLSSGGEKLWTVKCAKPGGTPKMVMGVSPISMGQRTLRAPVARVPASGSLCRVLLNQHLVARIRVRR